MHEEKRSGRIVTGPKGDARCGNMVYLQGAVGYSVGPSMVEISEQRVAPLDWEPVQRLLDKCSNESDPERLLHHLQAMKTCPLANAIQQGVVMVQLQNGQIIERRDRRPVGGGVCQLCQGRPGEHSSLASLFAPI